MNVLFLPQNIASMPSLTATELSKIPGVNATCLTLSVHKYQEAGPHLIVLRPVSKRKPFKWLFHYLTFDRTVEKWIKWADVLHYTWSPVYADGRDLQYARNLGKKIFVEWIGSDIRNPEYLGNINAYYKDAFVNGYEYASIESLEQSNRNQSLFASYGAVPLLCPEVSLFLNKNIFSKFYLLFQRLNTNDFKPTYPDVTKKRPLIVHSPTAKITKGSNHIIKVIEELKKNFDFEFLLLHDMKREDVLKIIQKADIFLDQIILGSYGMATMEALAFGKPVMCYLLPEVFEAGLPAECPIVNTNPDNLKEQLIKLINNPHLRNSIGRQSREYVEKYHDANKIATQLVDIYKMALAEKK